MTYYYATTHPTTTSITQYKSFGVHRLLGLLTVTGCIAMTCHVFDKVLVLENSFVANTICTISFHILFYVFFTLICYHHVYQIK